MRPFAFAPLAICLIASLGMGLACAKEQAQAPSKDPEVVLETSKGKIVLRLYKDKAPLSADNMLTYVKDGFYNGTVFHRVIPGFMIQGGGMTQDLKKKSTRGPIKNEATNGLKNKRGTVAMARTNDVNSATAQFFINVADNSFLDHTSTDPRGYGYAVFGEVMEGMDVVDKIVATKTVCPTKSRQPCQAALPPGMRDVPEEAMVITKAYTR